MAIKAETVRELREKTGAGMMDCKRALQEAGGDLDEAIRILREKGLAAAAKKTGRATGEGLIGSYIHGGGKLGVLVEVNCETDFVARTAEFQELVHDIAMQVAAAAPRFISRDDVPEEEIRRESEIFEAQAKRQGKPDGVVEKIVKGRLEKFYQEVCLLEQPFIKDPDRKVVDLINEAIARLGENIRVKRFARFVLGADQ